jgi:type VI secretion system protein ImpA
VSILYRWLGSSRETRGNPDVNLVDSNGILAPIAPEHPSGEKDLEYDPTFIALEEKTKGTPEKEFDGKIIQEAKAPNWHEIRQEAAALLTRTHDLRIAVVLLRALLHTEGLIGLSAGLDLLHGLMDRYWDTLFPRLDPAENNDPIQRINILMTLCSREAILGPLLGSTLGSSPTVGPCTLRDIHRAAGRLPGAKDDDTEVLSPETIDAIFKDSDPDCLQAGGEAVRRSLSLITGLEDLLKAKVGRNQAPRFEDLRRLLEDMGSTLDRHTSRHRSDVPPTQVKKTAPQPSASPTREPSTPIVSSTRAQPMDIIRNRQDVTRVLHQICLYYEKNEPASPVPLLLRRAAGLVEKNFFEIIQDVAPDSVAQIQKLMGET